MMSKVVVINGWVLVLVNWCWEWFIVVRCCLNCWYLSCRC